MGAIFPISVTSFWRNILDVLWLHPGIRHDLFRKGVMSAGANVLWSRRYPGRGLTDWLAALPPPPGVFC